MSVSPRFVFDVCHDVYKSIRESSESIPLLDPTKSPSDHVWRPHTPPTGEEFASDFHLACLRGLGDPQNASRLLLCKYYYLDLLPYERARNFLGIREDVFVKWSEDVRDKVGVTLLLKKMFPPRAYFGERSELRIRKGNNCATRVTGRSFEKRVVEPSIVELPECPRSLVS